MHYTVAKGTASSNLLRSVYLKGAHSEDSK